MKKLLKNIDSSIDHGLDLIKLIERSRLKVKRSNSFLVSKYIGRNFLGDIIRSRKVSCINSNIDRIQEEILKFDSKIKLLDNSLSQNITLPYKLTEFETSRSKLSDLILRFKMRKKQLDIESTLRDIKIVVRRLIFLRNKIKYKMRNEEKIERIEKQAS